MEMTRDDKLKLEYEELKNLCETQTDQIFVLTNENTRLEKKLTDTTNRLYNAEKHVRNDGINIRRENQELKQQLAKKEKFLEQIMSGEYIPASIAEKSLKLSNQTAIAELEKVREYFKRDFEIFNYIEVRALYKQLDKQIKSLKGKSDEH